jgi:cell division control protein 24
MLEERGLLLPPLEAADQPESITQNGALDARGNVVKELLMTERKYVQDLEVLQVRATSRGFWVACHPAALSA